LVFVARRNFTFPLRLHAAHFTMHSTPLFSSTGRELRKCKQASSPIHFPPTFTRSRSGISLFHIFRAPPSNWYRVLKPNLPLMLFIGAPTDRNIISEPTGRTPSTRAKRSLPKNRQPTLRVARAFKRSASRRNAGSSTYSTYSAWATRPQPLRKDPHLLLSRLALKALYKRLIV